MRDDMNYPEKYKRDGYELRYCKKARMESRKLEGWKPVGYTAGDLILSERKLPEPPAPKEEPKPESPEKPEPAPAAEPKEDESDGS